MNALTGFTFPPVSDRFTAFDQEYMRSKLDWASGIALAATAFTALLSAQGSGAAASDFIPTLTDQAAEKNPAELASVLVPAPAAQTAPRFVATPMVQKLPADVGLGSHTLSDDASSLAQLVSQQEKQPQAGALSADMRCLASAIYFEARGESLDGQLAVGNVVINRAQSGRFPASYCGVVYQADQFSFVRGRSMPAVREGSESWRKAIAIAQIAEGGNWDSPAEDALYFHAARVSPGWRLTRLARVDNHIFYR